MVFSVGIYKNKNGGLLLIPDGFDKNGIGRALNCFKKLEQPYGVNVIGKLVKECLSISQNTPIIEDVSDLGNVFEMATGIKGWSKFSKEHLHVASSLNPDKGYKFSPLKRVRGGGYLGEKGDPVIELGLDSSDEEIGEAVLKAFSFLSNN